MANWILKVLKPFVKWFGALHIPFTHKKINGKDYFKWRARINVGSVLLTVTRGEFSNILNPSKLKHAGIYIGKIDGVGYVAEAVGRGVVLTDLVTFLTTKDTVVVCNPKFKFDKLLVTEKALLAVEKRKPYDYMFTGGDKAFYCFELAVHCLSNIYTQNKFKLAEMALSKMIYNHNTFLDSEMFDVVVDSRSK